MSQQVQIDYKHIATECNIVCELAESKLKELDEMIAKLEESSSRLINEQSEMFKKELQKERDSILNGIKKVRTKAEEEAKMGVVHTDNHDARYQHMNDTINASKELENQVNVLSADKLVKFKGLLQGLLSDSLNDNYQRLLDQANGRVTISTEIQKVIDSVDDEVLKQYAYLAYLSNNTLSGDELIKTGKDLMSQTFESRVQQEKKAIREELEQAKVPSEVIDKVVDNSSSDLTSIRENATTEIIGEKVRQKSIKIIMSAVQERGFIIDKKNIKIDREKNEVLMVAVKASGERAEFKVYMDGKFIYDFHHGYQGQSCQKDIQPFMKDLEEVYGIHITKSQEIWSNPDKISTMKYQAINTNKNRG